MYRRLVQSLDAVMYAGGADEGNVHSICVMTNGARGPAALGWASILLSSKGKPMNNIVYIVGLVVIIGIVLGYFGLR